jgi:diacylglycerol kinase family enzyme
MKFGIIANPKSGATSATRKAETLRKASQILGGDTVLAGLDTTSREEFLLCAQDLAEKVDVMIVAGGDGTFSDIINAVGSDVTLSYLPLGSGCALRYALDLPPQVTRIARQIRDGRLHDLDLILCDESVKAFMASVGLEADILHRRETLQAGGVRGPHAYAMATFGSFFADLERTDMTIAVDDRTFVVPGAVTAIVTKIAYYGYNMKIVPDAVFDDRHLHLLAINSGWPNSCRAWPHPSWRATGSAAMRRVAMSESPCHNPGMPKPTATSIVKGRSSAFVFCPRH